MGACNQEDSSCRSGKSSTVKGEGIPCSKGGRVKKGSKRKSRAVAKPPTRVLSADKSTFRDIVLRLTGVPSSDSLPPRPRPRPRPPFECTTAAQDLTAPSHLSASPSPNLSHPLPLANTSTLSLPNDPFNSQSDSLSFANPITPLSTSHVTIFSGPPTSPSSDSALLHTPPYQYPLLDMSPQDATSDHISFSKILAFLKQSLTQLKSLESLLQIKDLGGCDSFNFELLGQYCNGPGVDLEPLPRSQLVDHTPKNINTYTGECVAHLKALDMEHSQNLQHAAELESFLLTRDDKLDDLFTSKYLNSSLFDTNHRQDLSLELGDTCL